MFSKNRGFTLIELIVAISIVGLISSVVISTLDGARAKARDAQRMLGIDELQKALALYYTDNGNYPLVDDTLPYSTWAEIASDDTNWNNDINNLHKKLVPAYIPSLPIDPVNTGGVTWEGGYTYTYSTYNRGVIMGSNYDLTVRLERLNPVACPSTSWAINTDTSDNWCRYPGPVNPNNSDSRILSDH